MPCDKTTQGLEGRIGFWDFLMGNFSPFGEEDRGDSSASCSDSSEAWYFYRINPLTRDVEYRFPPSENWSSYP